eukprot:TRINITY_DN4610_c0_g1_i1.p1 TRINITY_DN4610_c0_g1~~TRINITY_DN4610_c0_g1_i1.p1  ORF type:complete len:76 (+),score=24.29 TRINITY_DN4610_c0_g1_i1:214-441(+)
MFNSGDDVGFVFDDTIDCGYFAQLDFPDIPDQLASILALCGDGRIDFDTQNLIPFALGVNNSYGRSSETAKAHRG